MRGSMGNAVAIMASGLMLVVVGLILALVVDVMAVRIVGLVLIVLGAAAEGASLWLLSHPKAARSSE